MVDTAALALGMKESEDSSPLESHADRQLRNRETLSIHWAEVHHDDDLGRRRILFSGGEN